MGDLFLPGAQREAWLVIQDPLLFFSEQHTNSVLGTNLELECPLELKQWQHTTADDQQIWA
jgi:hypothetical protein